MSTQAKVSQRTYTTLEFHLPITPGPQRRARTRTGRPYKDKIQKVRDAEMDAALAPFLPDTMLEGPLSLEVTAVFPIPKSWNKTKTAEAMERDVPREGPPDADNLLKQICDRMQADPKKNRPGFFADDAHIWRKFIQKVYGANPGWHVIIWEG